MNNIEELERQARLGRLASEFTQLPMWKDRIKPYLEASRLSIALQNTRIPSSINPMSVDVVALSSVLNSGKVLFIDQFLNEFDNWIEDGLTAEKELMKRSKNEK